VEAALAGHLDAVRQVLRDMQVWLAQVEATGVVAPAGGVGRLDLRLMVPKAEATLDGRPVRLSSAQVKLVAGLVVEHPAPLHLEQASDLLWPDLPPTATRGRLNALVYRLRGRLGGHGRPDGVVWRDGELLGIDPARSDADLWRFRRDLAGSPAERCRALLGVRGLLCDAQFPYDERFVEERRRLCGLWLERARALARDGELAPVELRPALAVLRLGEADLGL
jgi:hypothetical protein